jgi:hypothetical protein
VAKVRSLTELCGLRVTVETTSPRRDLCSASDSNASAIRSDTAATPPVGLLVARLTYHGSAPIRSRSLSAVAVE